MNGIVTPVDVGAFEKLLNHHKYDKGETKFLIDGFKFGFEIRYWGPRGQRRNAPNLKLECGSRQELWEKIMKEVKLKRFAGPFKEPPFENYIQSPIGLVPKSNGDTRLIFHLSYPRTGLSVNSAWESTRNVYSEIQRFAPYNQIMYA